MLSHNEQPVWSANDEIEYYFERLGEAIALCSESRLKLYISGLLVALTERLEQHRPSLDESLSSAQRTVELFLASLPQAVGQHWDLTSMAAGCGFESGQYFSRVFREQKGCPPREYRRLQRREEAPSAGCGGS